MTFVVTPDGSGLGFSGTDLVAAAQRRARPDAATVAADSATRIRQGRNAVPDSRRVQPPVKAESLMQAQESRNAPADPGSPTDAEREQVARLAKRDAEVRRHEQAHAAAGGIFAGTPHYRYTRGPDGRMYATSGSTPIDTAPEEDPDATIRKMDTVIRAALAPADPSPEDLQVAAKARIERMRAQAEKTAADSGERQGGDETARAAGAYGATAAIVARAAEARASVAVALVV